MGTTYTTQRRKHGKHNERAYLFIKQEQEFADWAITCAFYCVIHYVESYLFPYTDYNGEKYETMNDFHHSLAVDYSSKHETRYHLVRARCHSIVGDYNRLKELCWKARYDSFNIDNPGTTLKDVDKRLSRIKSELDIEPTEA